MHRRDAYRIYGEDVFSKQWVDPPTPPQSPPPTPPSALAVAITDHVRNAPPVPLTLAEAFDATLAKLP